MTEPTDNDLDVLLAEHWPAFATVGTHPLQWMRAAMREAIAKWGTPPAVAGEPVAWYVTGCGRLLDEAEAKAEARHIGGTARAIPVYTTPQPSPASQGDALDAMRYRWLRENWTTTRSRRNLEQARMDDGSGARRCQSRY